MSQSDRMRRDIILEACAIEGNAEYWLAPERNENEKHHGRWLKFCAERLRAVAAHPLAVPEGQAQHDAPPNCKCGHGYYAHLNETTNACMVGDCSCNYYERAESAPRAEGVPQCNGPHGDEESCPVHGEEIRRGRGRLLAVSPTEAERLAQRFHEVYEDLAPSFGYETRKESAKPWAEVPERNKLLMTAVCRQILSERAAHTREAVRAALELAGEKEWESWTSMLAGRIRHFA